MNTDLLYLKWMKKWNDFRFSIMKHQYRRFIQFGPNADVYPGCVHFQGQGKVVMDEGAIVERAPNSLHLWVEQGAELRFGKRAWFRGRYNPNTFSLTPGAKVTIGDDMLITGIMISSKLEVTIGHHFLGAFGVRILDSDFHDTDEKTFEVTAPVRIGNYCWITSDVTILKGVTIGDHCIIGAGSLVTRDIPSHSFAAGRPAKVIKTVGDRSSAR